MARNDLSCTESAAAKTILQGTHVLEIWFLEFSLESLIPALVHGVLLEVIDGIDSLISSQGSTFYSNSSLKNSWNFLTIRALYESVASINGRRGEGYFSETFLRFSAGMAPDVAATSAAPLFGLTANTASKVVCTAARGGIVAVGGDVGPSETHD